MKNNFLLIFALIFLIGSIACVYAKSLHNPPVFDDNSLFWFGEIAPTKDFPLKNFPLGDNISNWADRRLSTWTFEKIYVYTHDIAAQRVFNIAIHILNTLLIYLMLFRFTKNISVSYFTAALFGLNPAAIYAVAYLAGRSILMATFFSLLHIILCHIAVTSKKIRDEIVLFMMSMLSYLLAISCKEHAFPLIVVFPLMIIIYCPTKKKKIVYGLMSTIAMIYFFKLSLKHDFHFGIEGGYYEYYVKELCGIKDDIHSRSIATQCYLFFKYFLMWLNPFADRSIDMRESFAKTIFSPPHVYGLVTYLLWAVVGVWLVVRRNVLGFAMCLLWCLFMVEVQTVRLGEMFVLYRSYLYSVCYMPIIAYFLNIAKFDRSTMLVSTGVFMLIFGAITFNDLDQFKTKVSLWKHAATIVKPENQCQAVRIYNNWGSELMEEGKPFEAIPILDKAISFGSSFATPLLNRAKIFLLTGNITEANKLFNLAKDDKDPKLKNLAIKGVIATITTGGIK